MDPMTFLEQCDALTEGQTPYQVLAKAKELISDSSRWAREATAQDSRGNRVHPSDTLAIKWDVEGAVAICSNPHGIAPPAILKFLDDIVLEQHGFDMGVGQFNDIVLDHGLILGVLDEALRRCA